MLNISDENATKIVPITKTYTISGKKLTFETGKLALLANGSITLSDENGNMLFTTIWFKEVGVNQQASFFPLVVDYQEKYYATGKIGWNRFMKREARPSETATLTARMIDRPIRPMFPKWIVNDTQVICSVLSSDNASELGSWGITTASLGLMTSWAPFEWPVSAVKVVLNQDWSYTYDPNFEQESWAKLHLVVAGTTDAITMVEAGANQVTNDEMLDALKYAHTIIKELCEAQIDFATFYEKQFWIEQLQAMYNTPDESLYAEVQKFLSDEKLQVLYNKWKKEFQKELDALDIEVKKYLVENNIYEVEEHLHEEILDSHDLDFVGNLVYKRVKEVMRKNILESWERLDGRKPTEVRSIKTEVWLLPRTHGSALFQRWMTQVLNITTLGWPDDEQTIDGMYEETQKRYMHHYNFPPYSVWEVRMMRGTGRREIGHGRLAERALEPVLPNTSDFPYTMRTVSEVTTCNGSSSMASVCGSTMSLMHAWVPLLSPVSAVAMGMIYDEQTGKYVILSDIQAQEDFLWDMDFKVARTAAGITAMQLDVKIQWLKMEVFEKAFAQWEVASLSILEEMLKTQPTCSKELSPYAPLIMNMSVPIEKISAIIGKGGENIQRIEKDYLVKVSIAEDGVTTITAKDGKLWQQAVEEIKKSIWEPTLWYTDTGKIVKIIEGVWVIVEYHGKNSGMVHISKLSDERVTKIEDVVQLWESIMIEVIQVDKEKWRIWLKRIWEGKKTI